MTNTCPKCQHENPDDTVYCGKCTAPRTPQNGIPVSHTKTLQTPIRAFTREESEELERMDYLGMTICTILS